MLDTDTKRRIDTARDILVGKVPDPKSQVEQITIALIYKFMDDMDAEAEEMGGKRKFFADDYSRYGWAKLLHSGLGGYDTLNLYEEAIKKILENPGIPSLFRDIFKNAYLPYRDPETLKSFLKVIDEFTYDHSERLGDAFEYLLSVLGSQGDAGQFRTPRHIIDFIVRIVSPKKDEKILDPACGTAGFLISSYKHILRSNTDPKGNTTLTPDEKGRLASNLKGYDISPDMVRLSLVNLYLHGFNNPHIDEYDTLTSEDKWNEFADVILANPPFMSPKGGIKPHNRFGVESKRSEVLFVDYIMEHLRPNGRAGIIVPEGIIFQSQGSYKDLRKTLVDNALIAVISLPTGVFNPYSGVKTSILILDKLLARQSDSIAFFKIENDGFGLGAQRREIEKNDLPQVEAEITTYMDKLRVREPITGLPLKLGLVVPKTKIAKNGDYNLSGERYREEIGRTSLFPKVSLGDVCDLIGGGTPSKEEESFWNNGTVKWLSSKHIDMWGHVTGYELISQTALDQSSTKIAPKNSTIIITRVSVGKYAFADDNYAINQDLTALVSRDAERLAPEFIHVIAPYIATVVEHKAEGIGVRGVTRKFLAELQIPMPPLDVQKEIVAEISEYQRVIDGARTVLNNYRPHISINPEWPLIALGELCIIERGASPRPINEFITESSDGINWIKIGDAPFGGKFITKTKERITPEGAAKSRRVKSGDFLLSNSMSFGRPYIMATDGCIHDGWLLLRDHSERLDQDFLYNILGSDVVYSQFKKAATGGVVNNLNSEIVRGVKIPLPSMEIQQNIVAEIEVEQRLIAANRELIERFEKKIQTTLARIWGEPQISQAEV